MSPGGDIEWKSLKGADLLRTLQPWANQTQGCRGSVPQKGVFEGVRLRKFRAGRGPPEVGGGLKASEPRLEPYPQLHPGPPGEPSHGVAQAQTTTAPGSTFIVP